MKNIPTLKLSNNWMGTIRTTEHTRFPPSGIWVGYAHNIISHPQHSKLERLLPRLETVKYN